jgi:hypothetical protein
VRAALTFLERQHHRPISLRDAAKQVDYAPRQLAERVLRETGQAIGERVRVSGFAFKRYGYPLPDVKISSSQGESEREGLRQETALLVGREAVWRPAPSGTREVDTLGWAFTAIAARIEMIAITTRSSINVKALRSTTPWYEVHRRKKVKKTPTNVKSDKP